MSVASLYLLSEGKELYEGAIRSDVDGKWHMYPSGSNGPYDANGYYQYIFDDFETARLTLEGKINRKYVR